MYISSSSYIMLKGNDIELISFICSPNLYCTPGTYWTLSLRPNLCFGICLFVHSVHFIIVERSKASGIMNVCFGKMGCNKLIALKPFQPHSMHIKPNEITKELMTGMGSTAKQSSMRDRAAVIVAPKYQTPISIAYVNTEFRKYWKALATSKFLSSLLLKNSVMMLRL